jgi:hypothetical protein
MPDFNDAGPQRSFELIPDGTVCSVRMTVRAGNAGEDGWLTRSNDAASEHLYCEFTVLDGTHAKHKFWGRFTLAGTTDNHAKAAEISRALLKAMLESARNIRPDDNSEAAKAARKTASYADFNGLCFICRVGIDPAKNGYDAKNRLQRVITPNETAWRPLAQQPAAAPSTAVAAPASAPAPIVRPAWGH